jgi:hypothetical protein
VDNGLADGKHGMVRAIKRAGAEAELAKDNATTNAFTPSFKQPRFFLGRDDPFHVPVATVASVATFLDVRYEEHVLDSDTVRGPGRGLVQHRAEEHAPTIVHAVAIVVDAL